MKELIAKIGKGPKASKDLTWEEAKQAMRLLIEGQATPAQVGGFLTAMSIKMESVSELAACTAAAREYVAPVPAPPGTLDLPVYARKQDTLHAAAAAAIVAAAGGAVILMHGYDPVPARPGISAALAGLGLPVDLEPKRAAEQLAAKGFAYLDIALYHPPVGRFLDLEQELGVRTLFHAVSRMLNPARAASQVIGVSHPPYLEKITEALRMLGGRRALVLLGVEGDPEVSIAAPTKMREIRDDRLYPVSVHPKEAGLIPGSYQTMAGFPPAQAEQEAGLLRRLLLNEVGGSQRDWIVLNAAVLLYAAGHAPSILAGVPMAQRLLDSGAAARKLAGLGGKTAKVSAA